MSLSSITAACSSETLLAFDFMSPSFFPSFTVLLSSHAGREKRCHVFCDIDVKRAVLPPKVGLHLIYGTAPSAKTFLPGGNSCSRFIRLALGGHYRKRWHSEKPEAHLQGPRPRLENVLVHRCGIRIRRERSGSLDHFQWLPKPEVIADRLEMLEAARALSA